MELADLAQGRVGRRVTSPLGGLKLQEVKGGPKALQKHIAEVIARLHKEMGGETGMQLFLVGASWRAIARIDMDRRDWSLIVLHEYRMTPAAVAATRAFIGANDVTNPAARDNPESPLYGMPILNVDQAANVVILKRSMSPGFAGIDNDLFYGANSAMLFGDAKSSVEKLVAAVKAA